MPYAIYICTIFRFHVDHFIFIVNIQDSININSVVNGTKLRFLKKKLEWNWGLGLPGDDRRTL